MADFKFISADGHLNDPPKLGKESKRNTGTGLESEDPRIERAVAHIDGRPLLLQSLRWFPGG
jgi:hypothetical protein